MPQGKLKIAFLHRANDPYTLERIKYFCKKKYEVYSISFPSFNYQVELEDVNIIRLRQHIIDKLPFIKRFSHYYELKKILKIVKPDILHIVNALNLFYSSINYSRIKIIENQGSDVITSPDKYKFLIPYYNYFYKKVNGIIQDSKIARDYGIKYGAPDSQKINRIIEIGIDFNIFNKNVQRGIVRGKYNLADRQIILHTRGIDKLYNIDIILQSILFVRKLFPDCVYILTTTRNQLDKDLNEFIIKNELEKNLLFVGRQDRLKSLKYFYRDADVNISVPSSDSSPFSVYESMACMTPNIVTNLRWLDSKFIDGKHLVTCPVRDSEKLADRILKVLFGQHKLCLDSAYNIVYEKINLQKEGAKLELLYKFLLIKAKPNNI